MMAGATRRAVRFVRTAPERYARYLAAPRQAGVRRTAYLEVQASRLLPAAFDPGRKPIPPVTAQAVRL